MYGVPIVVFVWMYNNNNNTDRAGILIYSDKRSIHGVYVYYSPIALWLLLYYVINSCLVVHWIQYFR